MNGALRKAYIALASLALVWAVGNTVYVYLILGGDKAFRIESAAFVLTALLFPLIFWRPVPAPNGRSAAPRDPVDGRWLILLTVGAWLIILGPYISLPFLSDDYVFLASYKQLSDVVNVTQFFRPMFALTFYVLARLGHGSPLPFHLFALLMHVTSAWFVYVLSRRLFRRDDAAALCFAIFLVNPLQLEAVLWVSGLQELLWTTAVLAALVVYTGRQELTVSRLATSLLLVACGLLSKETALSSVLLLPLSDWVFFRMKRGRLLPAAYLALGIVAVAYLFARSRSVSTDSDFFVTPGKYFVQKFVGTPYKFFVQPWNLVATHFPAVVLCGATVAAFALLFSAVLHGSGPRTLTGPAIILISTLPVYSYFYVAPDLRATRYIYFASFGWAILVTQLFVTVAGRRRTLLAASGGVIAVLLLSLMLNVRPWRTAGEIVRNVASTIREGGSVEMEADAWRAKYGDGIEVKNGLPTVYQGVYLFVNGYDELRSMLASDR